MSSGLKTQSDDRSAAAVNWNQAGQTASAEAALRAELERLRQRQDQIMTLIGCQNPDKLMHDLRNVLNELQLLRMLAATDKS